MRPSINCSKPDYGLMVVKLRNGYDSLYDLWAIMQILPRRGDKSCSLLSLMTISS